MNAIGYNTNFDLPKNIGNSNLQKIIEFYLLECPVKGVSYKGQTFKELGYAGSAKFSTLKKEMLRTATPSLKENYMPCTKNELSLNLVKSEKITYPDEYCVFLKNDEKTVICSLFVAIRNSLAHGSFNVKSYNKTRIYYLSNIKGYEKARIVLYEATLLSWIKLIKH